MKYIALACAIASAAAVQIGHEPRIEINIITGDEPQ